MNKNRLKFPTLFSETSILASRLKGNDIKKKIDAILKDYEWNATSYYCILEFGNLILTTAIYIKKNFDDGWNYQEVINYVVNVLAHQQKTKKTWTHNILSEIYGRTEKEKNTNAIRKVKNIIGSSITSIEKRFDHIVDDISCSVVKDNINNLKRDNPCWKTPSCKQNKKRCKIDEFFENNKATFEKVKSVIDSCEAVIQTEQLKKFSEIIEKASANPKILLDYKEGCKKFADALIAVESHINKYNTFFTQNIAESKILCKATEQDLIYLPNSLNCQKYHNQNDGD